MGFDRSEVRSLLAIWGRSLNSFNLSLFAVTHRPVVRELLIEAFRLLGP